MAKTWYPVIDYIECGNRCPKGAIEYVGDNTGWTSLNRKKSSNNGCGCSCGSNC